MTLLFANRAYTTLAGATSNTSTTATLAAGSGALFPDPVPGDYFKMTFVSATNDQLNEIVHVTARVGDVVTIVRAQEGTVALNWLSGDLAQNLITAGALATYVQAVAVAPSRLVTLSGAFVMTSDDFAVGLQRVTALSASSTVLPGDTDTGQSYEISDLTGNFNAYPVTVNAPPGHNIANLSAVVLNVNRQSAVFRYIGASTWSVKM